MRDLTLLHSFGGDTKGNCEEDSLTDWVKTAVLIKQRSPHQWTACPLMGTFMNAYVLSMGKEGLNQDKTLLEP